MLLWMSSWKLFGSGLEITLLAAIPAGSGLGTSSILAATVLGLSLTFVAWLGIRMRSETAP